MPDVITILSNNTVITEVAGYDVALATLAAQNALVVSSAQEAADRSEQAYEEILDFAAGAPDAPSIVNKLNRDGANADPDILAALPYDAGVSGSVPEGLLDYLRRQPLTPENFGAVGDGATNDSAAIQAMFDAALETGRGWMLSAKVYMVDNVKLSYTATTPVIGSGKGQYTSVLRKFGSSPDPVLTVEGVGALREVYSSFSSFAVDANGQSCPVIRLKDVARFSASEVLLQGGVKNIDIVGALTATFFKCNLLGGVDGVVTRSGAVTPNMISFTRCAIRGQSGCAIDFGDGEALTVEGCEIAGLGTPGDVETGGIFIRSTAGNPTPGGGTIRIVDNYFETVKGSAIVVETPAAGYLSVFAESNKFYDIEEIGGVRNCMVVGKVTSIALVNNFAAAATDTFAIAANKSLVVGGTVGVLNDTSDVYEHIHVQTASSLGTTPESKRPLERLRIGGIDYVVGDSYSISGGGVGVLEHRTNNASGGYLWVAGGAAQDRIGANVRSFFGGTPVVKQSVPAAATDATTTQALVNSIRTAFINYGLLSSP